MQYIGILRTKFMYRHIENGPMNPDWWILVDEIRLGSSYNVDRYRVITPK